MKSNGNGFEEMVAIQLAVRSWPGQAKLSAEDLGLKEQDVPEIFRLGNKRLYPEEWRQVFGVLANKARSCLNDNSYPFVVEYVRAIPKRNLARMVERLEELKAEYLARADEFVGHYEAIQSSGGRNTRTSGRGSRPTIPPRTNSAAGSISTGRFSS